MRKEAKLYRMRDLLLAPIVIQLAFLLLSSMIYDGGLTFLICLSAIVAYWPLIVWMSIRRKNALTKTDKFFVRFGFYFLFLAVLAAGNIVQGIYS